MNIKDLRLKTPVVGDAYMEDDAICVVFEIIDDKAYAISLSNFQDIECPPFINPLYTSCTEMNMLRFHSLALGDLFYHLDDLWVKIAVFKAWSPNGSGIKDIQPDQFVIKASDETILIHPGVP